jgi:molybdenum cofactor cytidylyltransferase
MGTATVLVLASGRGERFVASGGTGSKLQAMLAGKAVLERTLDAVRASGLPWHLEDAGHPGMGDSISAAVSATRRADSWLVLPGDLPLIRPDTLLKVARSLDEYVVVLPVYGGQRGHPVGFGRECRDALIGLAGADGAARVVQAYAGMKLTRYLHLDDPGTVTDIDTVRDLQDVERRLAR